MELYPHPHATHTQKDPTPHSGLRQNPGQSSSLIALTLTVTRKFHRILNRKQQWQLIICDLNIVIHYLTVVSCFPDRGNAHDVLEVTLNTHFLVQLWQDNVTPGCPGGFELWPPIQPEAQAQPSTCGANCPLHRGDSDGS